MSTPTATQMREMARVVRQSRTQPDGRYYRFVSRLAARVGVPVERAMAMVDRLARLGT